mmetsp:Transcript_56231/g.159608  ORF Transcript_56231/g.159608 Transcript_56231/m.159608 type:complete len:207 (+) Transcript_56231:181-801(+)
MADELRGPLVAHQRKGLARVGRVLGHADDREVTVHGEVLRRRRVHLVEKVGKAPVGHLRLVRQARAVPAFEDLARAQPAEEERACLPDRANCHSVEAAVAHKHPRPQRVPAPLGAELQAAGPDCVEPGCYHLHDLPLGVEVEEASNHEEVLHGGLPAGARGPVLQEVWILLHLLPVGDWAGPGKQHSLRHDASSSPHLIRECDAVR